MKIFLLVLALASVAFAEPHAYQLSESQWLVKSDLYVSVVNSDYKCPEMCCYSVTADAASGSGKSRNFKTFLPDASLESADYAKSGYDIGHLAPLGSFDGTDLYDDTNYLENCAPQTPNLNRGPWLSLENRERELAEAHGVVRVVVTCLFKDAVHMQFPNADEACLVPTAFQKRITWVDSKGQTHSELYVFPQDVSRSASIEDFLQGT